METEAATLVNESWEVTAYAVPNSLGQINLFDLAIIQTNATANALRGRPGLNVGVSARWIKADWSQLIVGTRHGSRDEDGPLRWVGMSGPGKSDEAGIVVLIKSSDSAGFAFGGLNDDRSQSVDIFPKSTGDAPFAPHARTTHSYRVIVFDGPPDTALLEALWNGYTVPAVVTVTPAER